MNPNLAYNRLDKVKYEAFFSQCRKHDPHLMIHAFDRKNELCPIGSGSNGQVFAATNSAQEHLALKIRRYSPNQEKPEEEYRIQRLAYDCLAHDGQIVLRVPKPIWYLAFGGNKGEHYCAILMERVYAAVSTYRAQLASMSDAVRSLLVLRSLCPKLWKKLDTPSS